MSWKTFALLLCLPALAQADITSNLYASYPFDAGGANYLYDVSGNNLHLSAANNAHQSWGKGFRYNALQTNFNNHYESPASHSTSNNDYAYRSSLHSTFDNSYTLAINVYPHAPIVGSGSANDGGAGIMLWGTGDVNGLFIGDDDKINCAHTIAAGSTRYTATSTTALTAQRWYNVACVVDKSAGTVKLYVDGTLEDTENFTANEAAYDHSSNDLKLGILVPSGSTYRWMFDGRLDDARIYKRALAAADVQELMGVASAYPCPATGTYTSSVYSTKVRENPYYGSWNTTCTYGFSREAIAYWDQGNYPSVHEAIAESTGGAYWEITKTGGSVSSFAISPHSKNVVAFISSGKLYVWSGSQESRLWVTINGDDTKPLFLITMPNWTCPSIYATGYSTTADIYSVGHYVASDDEIICVNPGVIMRGNIDARNKDNVTITGPGIILGNYWSAESVTGSLSYEDTKPYWMVSAEGSSNVNVSYVSLVMSPSYNIRGASTVYGVNILSPWYFSTDGVYATVMAESLVFVGDTAYVSGWANWTNQDTWGVNSLLATTNNSTIVGGYKGAYVGYLGNTAWMENIDILSRSIPNGTDNPMVLSIWVDDPNETVDSDWGFANQWYNGFRIEGSYDGAFWQVQHKTYPWGGGHTNTYGQIREIHLRDWTFEGTQGDPSTFSGYDSNNTTLDWSVEYLKINGTDVTSGNYWSYITTGYYSSGTIVP